MNSCRNRDNKEDLWIVTRITNILQEDIIGMSKWHSMLQIQQDNYTGYNRKYNDYKLALNNKIILPLKDIVFSIQNISTMELREVTSVEFIYRKYKCFGMTINDDEQLVSIDSRISMSVLTNYVIDYLMSHLDFLLPGLINFEVKTCEYIESMEYKLQTMGIKYKKLKPSVIENNIIYGNFIGYATKDSLVIYAERQCTFLSQSYETDNNSLIGLFENCKFRNMKLNGMVTDKIKSITGMFIRTYTDVLSINNLDFSSVENIDRAFELSDIEELDISNIDIMKLKSFKDAFKYSKIFRLKLKLPCKNEVEELNRVFEVLEDCCIDTLYINKEYMNNPTIIGIAKIIRDEKDWKATKLI